MASVSRRSRGPVRAALLACLLLLHAGVAAAKIYLDINAPAIRPLPLAVQTFRSTDPAAADPAAARELHDTLSDDLAFSGFFDLLDPVTFVEPPEAASIHAAAIHFEDWRAVGAEALIQGVYTRQGRRLRAEFHLFDVIQQKRIVAQRYYGALSELRSMAHKFANRVVREITGEAGVFDTWIAYVRRAGTAYEIHVADYDGHNDRVLLSEPAIVMAPHWSPDAEKIVFTSYRAGNPDLYQIVLRTGEVQKVSAQPGINTGGVYSPGGGRLAYVLSRDGNPEIYVLDKYSRRPRRLTRDWATDVHPSWSPDGKRIAFMSDRGGSPQIYVLDTRTGETTRLTFRGSYNAAPAWSPRGDRIAFASMVDGRFQIATIRPDGTDMVLLTANRGNNEDPSWSPDGRFLCFSSTMDGTSQIYIMNANGANLRKVTSGSGRKTSPDWSPRLFSP